MNNYNNSFINRTKDVWQPYYQEELSDDDAIEIIDNMIDLVNLLTEWDREDQKNESCKIGNIHNKKGAKNG